MSSAAVYRAFVLSLLIVMSMSGSKENPEDDDDEPAIRSVTPTSTVSRQTPSTQWSPTGTKISADATRTVASVNAVSSTTPHLDNRTDSGFLELPSTRKASTRPIPLGSYPSSDSNTDVMSTTRTSSVAMRSRFSSSDVTGIAVPLAVVVTLLTALIIVFIILHRRRRKSPESVSERASVLAFLRTTLFANNADVKVPTYEEIQEANGSASSSGSGRNELETATTADQSPSQSSAAESHSPIYAKPAAKPTLVSSTPSASASFPASVSGLNEVYRDTSTTLVDNTLYDVQQPPLMTSSNVDDYVTVIENDLYEHDGQAQGQQNTGSADYECTLIDNDLYR